MIKAAFFDVDGTLLSHKSKSVPQSTRAALKKLQQQGIRCVVATGRQIDQLDKLPVADIPFDGYLTLNGQMLHDQQKQLVFARPITGRGKEYLIQCFENHVFPALVVEEKEIYLNYVTDHVHKVQEGLSSAIPPLGKYTGNDIYQVCAYLRPDEVHLLDPIAEECFITRWHFGGMDVVAKGGGKVSGIREYMAQTGLKREEIIAFGDGDNDIEMLRYAAIGVAMGNAAETVKAAADFVTADIDDDGIEKALIHLGLISE